MPLEYRVFKGESLEATHYSFSYRELQRDYRRYVALTDAEFIAQVVPILHFAVFVCWLKEASLDVLADNGLLHELVHLLDPNALGMVDLAEVRRIFRTVCELA